jgi:hypothetical protein
MKKIVIINHGGQLCNQLWNYLSVATYALEKNYDCRCPAFFQYERFFPKAKTSFWAKYVLNPLFRFFPRRRNFINRLDNLSQKIIFGKKKLSQAVKSTDEKGQPKLFLLPPSENKDQRQKEKLASVEQSEGDIIFSGYAFRNPIGAAKYHDQICNLLSPKPEVKAQVDAFIAELRKKYDLLVGVHIRQNDYKTCGERFYYPPEKAIVIINNFYTSRPKTEKICFIVASDEKIDIKIFGSAPAVAAPGGLIEDLFTLASTDFIIGSNSSFGAFAAYYGDIPMAIFKPEPINWNFYLQQKKFFFDPESIAHLLISY